MAKVIGYESEAPFGPRPGLGEKVRMELPPIKLKEKIGEKELIRFKQPRRGTDDEQRSIDAVYDITTRLVNSVQARVEWLQMQALSEASVAYNENNVQFDVDFGVGQQYDADTDGTGYWDVVATADPITDLVTWQDDFITTYGFGWREIVMSRRARAYLFQNTPARDLIRGATGPEQILSPGELSAVWDRYGLPPISTYDLSVESEAEDGTITSVRTMDYHRAFIIPDVPDGFGETLFGPTAEAISDLLGTTLASEAPGIIAKTYADNDPVAEYVKAAAIAFPSLHSAELLTQIEVLSSGV
jgi:hypothetical protein